MDTTRAGAAEVVRAVVFKENIIQVTTFANVVRHHQIAWYAVCKYRHMDKNTHTHIIKVCVYLYTKMVHTLLREKKKAE